MHERMGREGAHLLGRRLARWRRLASAIRSWESCCSCSQWRMLPGPLRGASSLTVMGEQLPHCIAGARQNPPSAQRTVGFVDTGVGIGGCRLNSSTQHMSLLAGVSLTPQLYWSFEWEAPSCIV